MSNSKTRQRLYAATCADSASFHSTNPVLPPSVDQPLTLLGGLTSREFMRDYWHKKPLLVRGAIPSFTPPLDFSAVLALSEQEYVESRLIQAVGARWHLQHGPISATQRPKRDADNWTVLVQGANLHDRQCSALMHEFRFIPDARLDDLMISAATNGGGVGPHFDSYDVFLLQAHGQRRWQISQQKDLSLIPDMPLKILANFIPEQEWILEPGDMLYLPPCCAHDGIALGDCMTYSIGFKSPTYMEMADGFLGWLTDRLEDHKGFDQRYADPRQVAVSRPAAVPKAMVSALSKRLKRLQWDDEDVAEFLGEWLSEPKPSVFFTPPDLSLNLNTFVTEAKKYGLRLHCRSQMLYTPYTVFLNGQPLDVFDEDIELLSELADVHCLSPEKTAQLLNQRYTRETLWECYENGWIELNIGKDPSSA
jgi:50S ribosomal protein L16 3-hydroxylase